MLVSGEFGSTSLDSIIIPVRQRRKQRSPEDLNRLKRSIQRRGLLHPIVIDRNNVLVAGEGRVIACKSLGWTHIPRQYVDELTPQQRELMEAEENTVREKLDWQDEHDAYMTIINMLRQEKPRISLDELADELNMVKANVSMHLTYDSKKHEPAVIEAARGSGFAAGYRAAVRVKEREMSDLINGSIQSLNHTHQPVRVADFRDWAPAYSGTPFNLIHCDFPYGINAHQHAGQNSALFVDYTDTEDLYWELLRTLTMHLDQLCAESAHLIFWFSPSLYCETRRALELLDGFKFEEHPLIWIRGENEGIAPDPARRPRRIYEMAFFGWRGDRKIIRTKANAFVAPTERERHPHEKSEAALRHWMEMCVDGNTRLLDPTCGSGSALRAALSHGASSVLGLELNPDYAEIANRSLEASCSHAGA